MRIAKKRAKIRTRKNLVPHGRYRYHRNTAGSKPALNNGFDLFSENPVISFFPSVVSGKLKKYWPIDTGLVRF